MTPQEMLLAAELLEFAAAELSAKYGIAAGDPDMLKNCGIPEGSSTVGDTILDAFRQWLRSDNHDFALSQITQNDWMNFLAARLNREAVRRVKEAQC